MEPEDNGIYTFAPNNPRSNADRYLARHGIEDLFEVRFFTPFHFNLETC
uniref:Transposase n=1 Tax=Mesocestoides corti TaxID=53468 RepID=A0A5K3FF42_MESCO